MIVVVIESKKASPSKQKRAKKNNKKRYTARPAGSHKVGLVYRYEKRTKIQHTTTTLKPLLY